MSLPFLAKMSSSPQWRPSAETHDGPVPSFILATSKHVPSPEREKKLVPIEKLVPVGHESIDIIPSEASARTLMMRLEPEIMRLAGEKAILQNKIDEQARLSELASIRAGEREAALEVQLVSLQHGLCEYHATAQALSIDLSDAERRVQLTHAVATNATTTGTAEGDVLRMELRQLESHAAALLQAISLTRDRSLHALALRRTKRETLGAWESWLGVWHELVALNAVATEARACWIRRRTLSG